MGGESSRPLLSVSFIFEQLAVSTVMKRLWSLLPCVVAIPAFAQIDASLLRQAESWKRGEAPPLRLLKFPDGKIDGSFVCGMRVIGTEVGDYVARIKDPDLLKALLLDSRAQPDTVRAAASQLISLKGTDHVASLLASHPSESARSELAVLAQLLRSPYAAIQVVRISKEDMELSGAERALQEMRDELEGGISWDTAYGKAAEKNPDLKDREKDPTSIRTVVCYLYDSVVSPTGFDVLSYTNAQNLLPQHLQEVFRMGRRTQIFKTADAVYLYHKKSQ